jgi:hypothetical protein
MFWVFRFMKIVLDIYIHGDWIISKDELNGEEINIVFPIPLLLIIIIFSLCFKGVE